MMVSSHDITTISNYIIFSYTHITTSKYFYDLYYNQRETIKSSLLCKLLAKYDMNFQNNIKSFEGYKNIFKFAEKFPVWPSEMVTNYFNRSISA